MSSNKRNTRAVHCKLRSSCAELIPEHSTHHTVAQADRHHGEGVASNRSRVEAAAGAKPRVFADRHVVPHVCNLEEGKRHVRKNTNRTK